MADVARLAGVHPATVSRVLSGKDDEIARHTRDRIIHAAMEIGYLRGPTVAPPVIGLLERMEFSTALTAFSDLPRLLAIQLERRGFDLALVGTSCSEDLWSRRQRHAPLAGLITSEFCLDQDVCVAKWMRGPIVILNGHGRTPYDTVITDDTQGMGEAMARMIALGHRSFAFVRWPVCLHPSSQAARWKVVQGSAAAAGGSAREIIWETGALTQVLRRDDAPTALIFYHNMVYESARDELRETDRSVPGDLSILCGNDAEYFNAISPRMAAIDINLGAMVEQAVAMVAQRIAGTGPAGLMRITVPQRIVPGGTIGPVAIRR